MGPEHGYLFLGTAPLVGREMEMHLLGGLLERAAAGEAQLATLAGEPGVGKTRLLAELSARAAATGWRVLRGGADEARGLSPYQPFVEALRAYVDAAGVAALRRHAGPWAPHLARLLPELASARAQSRGEERAVLFEAWAQVLRRLTLECPLLLALDDLQWMDAAGADLLLYLRRRLRDARLLMVATFREGEVAADGPLWALLVELNRLRLVAPMGLRRLDRVGTAALLGGLLGAPAAPRLAELVFRESEGNPFFAEETARSLVERGRLEQRDGAWDTREDAAPALPSAVRDAIRARLRHLDSRTLALLQAASVLGRQIALAELASLFEIEPGLAAAQLGTAVERGLVVAEDEQSYRFSHDKVRETLYQGIPATERRLLHQRAAELLMRAAAARPASDPPSATPADPSRIAQHFLAGSTPERALPLLVAAGEQALAASAYRDAAQHFARAASLLRGRARHGSSARSARDAASPRLATVLLQLGVAQATGGEYDRALASFEAALAAPGAAALAGELHERIGSVHLARDEAELAERAYARALEALPPGDEARRAEVLMRLGQLRVANRGRLEEGDALLQEALALARARGEPRLEAEVISQLGQAAMHRGDFAAGQRHFETALELATGLSDPGLTGLASDGLARLHYWTGAMLALRTTAQRELSFARRTGDPHRLGWPTFWLAQATLQLGEWTDARRHADALVRLGEELGAPRFQAQGHELRGILAHQRGALDEAVGELRQAVAHFRAVGPGVLVYYLGPACLALIDAGAVAEADALLGELLGLAYQHPRWSSPRVQACNVAALALLRLGRDAGELEQELLPAAEQHHWHLVSRTLGMLATAGGRWEQATRHLETARQIASRGGSRLELAQVLLAEAALAGRRGAAVQEEALTRQAAKLLAALGAPPPAPHPVAPPAPAGLSARELEVLRLVAQGRSNREIAAALSIAEKTAVNHLTHILDKVCLALHGREHDHDAQPESARCLNRAALTAFAIHNGLV